MKIVYCVAQCNAISGGLRVIFEHVNRLSLRGHTVEIWTLDPYLGNAPFPIGVPIKHIPNDYDFSRQKLHKLHFGAIKGVEPDIFVAGSYPAIFGYTSISNAKPFWYLQHDEAIAVATEILPTYFEALKLPVSFLCNSLWTKETLAAKYKVEAEIIKYGIDTALFYPEKDQRLISSSLSLVFVYDGQDWKGVDDMFLAIKEVKKKIPKLNLLVISKFQSFGHDFSGLSAQVFIKPIQNELRRVYSSATIFVSSSWHEGFGLPGLEAMACGVPVVTTDSGGVREYAIPEETAVVVPPQNPQALADAIVRVLDDESLRKKLIKNGLEKVKEFDWNKSIDKLENIFQNSLSI